jgi:hypothetical protein
VRECVKQTFPAVNDQAAEEDAQRHCIDEVGVTAQNQIGTSDAPEGDTPVLKVPKSPIEHNVMSSVTPAGDLVYWPFPGMMTAPKCIDLLAHLVSETSTQVIVVADRHPAHETKAVEPWWAGRESAIALHGLPRYAPKCTPDELLHNDLKQALANEPMPESPSALRDTIGTMLDRIAGMRNRIWGYFKQMDIDFALN